MHDIPVPVVLIGAGRMGGALARGWIAGGLDPRDLVIVEPDPGSREALRALDCTLLSDPMQAPHAGVMVLAVKPQTMADVLSVVAPLAARALVLSIAAGIQLATLRAALPAGARVVRAMPNIPAAVGHGATALVGETPLPQADHAAATTLMRAVGEAVWLTDEVQMDAATAVSGSGPAYVFHMVEALAAAGEAEGLDPVAAMTLARATVMGAGALLRTESTQEATALRAQVTSPGGTTEAGLRVLMDDAGGLTRLLADTVKAAANRSRELG